MGGKTRIHSLKKQLFKIVYLSRKSDQVKLAIAIFTNRKDFSLAKICVSSIRHFYPTVEIFLIKDLLNGNFNSKNLQKAFNVGELKMSHKFFGWGAAKVHFLFNEKFKNKRYLCLDADTIFVGEVLKLLDNRKEDFVINAVEFKTPLSDEAKDLYIDPELVVKYYPDYKYPGYFFNSGQFLGRPGLLSQEILAPSFNVADYPFYKNRDAFKLVDQAVLNAVLPVYSYRQNREIGQADFMRWSVTFFNTYPGLKMKDLHTETFPFIVHYAGDNRTHKIQMMKGYALLADFRRAYHSRLTRNEIMFEKLQDTLCAPGLLTKTLYRKNWAIIKLKKLLGI